MISSKLQFVFIHIPKTGGNSLQWYLRECSDHQIRRRQNKMGPNDGLDVVGKNKHQIKYKTNFFKFCIVRNPYDRALSWYFFINPHIKNYDKNSFINFIKKLNIKNHSQYPYLDDPTIHKIHFENMIEELKELDIFKNTKYTFEDFPRLNSSVNFKYNWEDLYDQETKDIVYEKFHKDFEVCGYKELKI